eukprot:3258407-Karenia_brevis.AAC.1
MPWYQKLKPKHSPKMFKRVGINGKLVSQDKNSEVTAEYLESIQLGLNIKTHPANPFFLLDDSEEHYW